MQTFNLPETRKKYYISQSSIRCSVHSPFHLTLNISQLYLARLCSRTNFMKWNIFQISTNHTIVQEKRKKLWAKKDYEEYIYYIKINFYTILKILKKTYLSTRVHQCFHTFSCEYRTRVLLPHGASETVNWRRTGHSLTVSSQ